MLRGNSLLDYFILFFPSEHEKNNKIIVTFNANNVFNNQKNSFVNLFLKG